MASTETPNRLCIYCRTLEPVAQPCPYLEGKDQSRTDGLSRADAPISGLNPEDTKLIQLLQAQPSVLCTTCSGYDVIRLLTKSDPLDWYQRKRERDETGQPIVNVTSERVNLGVPSSLVLNPSCQLCRMLYCIVPRYFKPERGSSRGEEPDLFLEPYRTYLRWAGWDVLSEDMKQQHAVMIGITTSIEIAGGLLDPETDLLRAPTMTGPSIALELDFVALDRRLQSLKPIEDMLDLSLLRQALDQCLESHGDGCHVTKPASLLTTHMIDVNRRVVVPYPGVADYVALSYVWGGVQATHKALEDRDLPRTIEDAITVTKALGLQYLWVC